MKEKLLQLINKTVVIRNLANADMDDNKMGFNFAGKLEYLEETQEFFVRVGSEDYFAGAMGISFKENHIAEINEGYTAIIVLK